MLAVASFPLLAVVGGAAPPCGFGLLSDLSDEHRAADVAQEESAVLLLFLAVDGHYFLEQDRHHHQIRRQGVQISGRPMPSSVRLHRKGLSLKSWDPDRRASWSRMSVGRETRSKRRWSPARVAGLLSCR